MSDPRAILALTGASGFVGRAILRHLLGEGYRIRVLQRPPESIGDADVLGNTFGRASGRASGNTSGGGVEVVVGDLFDDDALDALLKNTRTLIHLVGIIREIPGRGQTFDRIHHHAVTQLIDHAQRNNLDRLIHMSALGTRVNALSDYHRTKFSGEQAVRDSGLNWTIFRPSLILGNEGELVQMVKSFWCDRLPPFVPYFGKGVLGLGGSGLVQPVAVEDVARCFVEAIDRSEAASQTYELGGPEVMDWATMYRRIRGTLSQSRRKPVLAVPMWWAMLLASLPGVKRYLPFNRAQVIMAREDSVCGIDSIERAFGFEPRRVEQALGAIAG